MAIISFRRHKRRAARPEQPTPLASGPDGGRRQMACVPYLLPKDAAENQRLDFQHYYFKALFGTNVLAPLPRPLLDVLDVGCGSGVWVRELAQAFPLAHVVGVDVELPPRIGQAQAQGRVVDVPNYEFRQANMLEGLPFPDQRFDYVHQRLLAAAIPDRRWPEVVSELARVTRIGGWIELVEGGAGYHPAGPATRQMLAWSQAVAGQRGISGEPLAHLPDLLRAAGLSQVEGWRWRAPLGKWARRPADKHAGGLLAADMLSAFGAMQGLCYRHLRLTASEWEVVLKALPGEWERLHTAYDWYVVYGQRGR